MTNREKFELLGKQNVFRYQLLYKSDSSPSFSLRESYSHWRKENGTDLWTPPRIGQ